MQMNAAYAYGISRGSRLRLGLGLNVVARIQTTTATSSKGSLTINLFKNNGNFMICEDSHILGYSISFSARGYC